MSTRGTGWIARGAAATLACAACLGCGAGSEDEGASDVGWDTTGDGGRLDSVPGADADADADSSWREWSSDGASDSAVDSWEPDDASAPDDAADVEAIEDVEDGDDAEVVDICDLDITEPQVLYLSADDSNSQASPIIARWLIHHGRRVPASHVRTYEFLNYYAIDYPRPALRRVNVVPEMRTDLAVDGRVTLQIGVQGHALTDENRRPVSLTLSLDTSGSMSGTPIHLERQVVRAIAASLRAGDTISAVTWSTTRDLVLSSHVVSGPNDPVILDMADGLAADGSTDLDSGLRYAYELAEHNYRAGTLNRVVLVSDGQANVGVTAAALVATSADDAEREGIYLVGVGVGEGYNDRLMDEVTDRGKGAYVFIDDEAEARKQFVDRFYQNFEIAVLDVRVELTLPPQLRMEEFHGEEISTIPEEVDPQHLAPDDAMVFHQYLVRCPELADSDVIRAVAEYTDPYSGERRSDAAEGTVAELLEGAATQLYKGNAIVEYAEGLKDVYELLRAGDTGGAGTACDELTDRIGGAAAVLDDVEIDEIHALLAEYCANLEDRSEPW